MTQEKNEPTHTATIYIAGDVAQAKQVCREYCKRVGLCVTITPTTFIYTGGEEEGLAVGLMNYPRFPTTASALLKTARTLADELRDRLCQHSYSIVTNERTYWSSEREAP